MSTDGTYQKIEQAPRIISRDPSGRPTRGHSLYKDMMRKTKKRVSAATKLQALARGKHVRS